MTKAVVQHEKNRDGVEITVEVTVRVHNPVLRETKTIHCEYSQNAMQDWLATLEFLMNLANEDIHRQVATMLVVYFENGADA